MSYKEVPLISIGPDEAQQPPIGPYNPDYIPPGQTQPLHPTPKAEDLLAMPGVSPATDYQEEQRVASDMAWENLITTSDWGDEIENLAALEDTLKTREGEIEAEIDALLSPEITEGPSIFKDDPVLGWMVKYNAATSPLTKNKIDALTHEKNIEIPLQRGMATIYSQLYRRWAQVIQVGFDPNLSASITDNRMDTVEEVLAMYDGLDDIPKGELDKLKIAIQEVIDYYVSGEGGGKVAPEDMEYDPLMAPEQPSPPRPVSLHQLTTQEILDSMAFMPPPDTTFTQDEWEAYLKGEELYSAEDIDDWYQQMVNEYIADWEDTKANLNAYRKGMAEMPEYTWKDMLTTAVMMPTLALVDTMGCYFRHISQPLAGLVYGAFLPEIQSDYNRLTDPSSSTWDRWMAYGEAWEGWDAPGDGTLSWMLKYLVMEGAVDPLSYVGFGLATKATRPFGAFGRLIKSVEVGFNVLGEVPVDIAKWTLGRITPTMGQKYILYGAGALRNKGKVEEMYIPAKRWRDLTSEETVDIANKAITHFRENPLATDRTAKYGRDLLIAKELDEPELITLITRLEKKAGGNIRNKEELTLFLTKQKVADVQQAFELNFLFRSKGRRLLPDEEAAELIRVILGINPSDHTHYKVIDRAIAEFLENRSKQITDKATSIFGAAGDALRGAAEWNHQMFRYLSDAEQSATALSMKDKGPWSRKLAQVPIDVQRVWVNYIDKHIVKTFAEAYLTFGMYGPMNTFEDVFRSLLSGVNPHRMQVDDWMTLSHGLDTDPNLWLHAGISELYGPFKAYGVGPDWSNWLLQGFGLWAGPGERLYKYGVRWFGALSQDFRRNAMSGYYMKYLKEEAPEALEQLGRIIGKGPNMGDKELFQEVSEYLTKIVTTGRPELAREVDKIFSSVRLSEKKLVDILGKHPNLSNDTRAMIMEEFKVGRLSTPQGIQNAINKVTKYTIDEALNSPEAITKQVDGLMKHLMDWQVESLADINQVYQALTHTQAINGEAYHQFMGALTESTRGLKQADRTIRIDRGMDELLAMSKANREAMKPVLDKLQGIVNESPYINKVNWGEVKWSIDPSYFKGYKVADRWAIDDAMKAELIEVIDSLPLDIKFNLKRVKIDPAACDKVSPTCRAIYNPNTKTIAVREGWEQGLTQEQKEVFYHEMGHAVMDARWESGEGIQLMQDFAINVAGDAAAAESMQLWWARTFEKNYKMTFHTLSGKTEVLTGAQVRRRMGVHSGSDGWIPVKNADGTTSQKNIKYRDWHEAFTDQFEVYCSAPEDITAEAFQAMLMRQQVNVEMMVSYDNMLGMAERSLSFFKTNFPRSQKLAHISPANKEAYQNLHDLLLQTRLHGEQFAEANFQSRRDWFLEKESLGKKVGDEWWARFDRDMIAQMRAFRQENIRLWGQILKASKKIDNLSHPGVERAPIILTKEASPADIAHILGVRSEDITSHLMDTMSVHNDRDYFIEYVLGHVIDGDVGFTPESIGVAYDQMVRMFRTKEGTVSWISGVKKETEVVRGEIHDLYLQGAHQQRDLDAAAQWGREVGDAMDELLYRGGAAPGEKLPQAVRVPKGGFPKEAAVPEEAAVPAYGWRSQQGAVPSDAVPYAAIPTEGAGELAVSSEKLIEQGIKHGKTTYVPGAPPPGARVPTEMFSDFQAARQRAMDKAHKQYYKEFPDYTNQNAADAAMKTIFPFWTYEMNRWLYIPRLFMQKPGVMAQFARYQDHSDNGYLPLWGDVQFNPFRGTVLGTVSTRLFKKDYPEYYDRFSPVVGFGLEGMDYLSRFGFYPGVHISAPISLLGGLHPQTGEILPSIIKTPLAILTAIAPDNQWVNTLTETIFPERFRDYMTSLQATKYGGDGQLILAKLKADIELTEEEHAIWTQARQYVGMYSAIAEQFGVFRMRPEEKVATREAAYKVIEEYTGFNKEQQIWMQRHGYRVSDQIGGLHPELQAILEEMDYYKWSGHAQALLPSRQQIILDRNTLDWDEVNRFVDSQDLTRQQLQDELLSGSIGSGAYDDEMAKMFMETGNMIDQKQKENPYMTHEGKIDYYNEFGIPMPVDHPMKELLRLYHSVKLERVEDHVTGEMGYDWDRFFAHRQLVIDSLPDHLRHEWEAEVQKNMTDIEIIRHDVYNTYFRKYYDVAEITREQFPENEAAMITEYYSLNRRQLNLDRQAQIKAHISAFTGLQLISSYSSNLADNRKALRYKNPHLDAWLFYWGRTDSFLTPSAESMFPVIAQQTGRSIIK